MKSIWKFPIEVTDTQRIEMPMGAKIISVQTQNDIPCLWAISDNLVGKLPRIIWTFGTGHPIDKDLAQLRFIGTYQLMSGGLVFHVFEEG